jgi:hypothetical protein
LHTPFKLNALDLDEIPQLKVSVWEISNSLEMMYSNLPELATFKLGDRMDISYFIFNFIKDQRFLK